jgi:hypothetical protein
LGGYCSILSSNFKPKIPKVTNYWNQKVVVACIHPPQYWVQQQEWLFMDKKNSHDQDDGNHYLCQEDNYKLLGRPKNLISFKVRKAIYEG